MFGLVLEAKEGPDGYGRRNGSQASVSPCRLPRALGLEWHFLLAYPPLVSMTFIMSPGGGGWWEGVKLLIAANFLLKMSRLFCLN